MKYLILTCFVIGLASVCTSAHAGLCMVYGVSDGDTITVRCGEGEQQRVRLAEIDAPESGQAFGQRAKKQLSDLVHRREVRLDVTDRDHYGRLVAHVYTDDLHVNRVMLQSGLAWCYRRYAHSSWCISDEGKAREAHRGLWAEPKPLEPWKWRQRRE